MEVDQDLFILVLVLVLICVGFALSYFDLAPFRSILVVIYYLSIAFDPLSF